MFLERTQNEAWISYCASKHCAIVKESINFKLFILVPVFIAFILFIFSDHVFEVMMYVDDSVYYDKSSSVIDNQKVIQEIVKKSGMRARIVPPPDLKESESINKDATKRLVK
jgi:hypothetical protein